MIANSDVQNSTIDVLVFQALKQYSTNALVPMLEDKDVRLGPRLPRAPNP